MQAVNAIVADIAKHLTPPDRHGDNDGELSRLQRRNSCKLENILFKRHFRCGINAFQKFKFSG